VREKDAHFKKYGAQFSEFMRLDYFDLTRMLVVDPMHNLLLGGSLLVTLRTSPFNQQLGIPGLVKDQWYKTWILNQKLRKSTDKTLRELDQLHRILSSVRRQKLVFH
jgi:hypothetical protein